VSSGDLTAGFVSAILESLEDDTPRLIYADWLEERGDPRGEFIRLQCARAALPEWDRRAQVLLRQERVLLEQHGAAWRAELPRLAGITWDEFERGVVTSIHAASFETLYRHAKKIWQAAPVVRVMVTGPSGKVRLDKRQALPRLRSLKVTPRGLTGVPLAQLADAPLLSSLQTLDLANCGPGINTFADLFQSPHLANLSALVLANTPFGFPDLRALAYFHPFKGLTSLTLRGRFGSPYEDDGNIGRAGVRILTQSPSFSKLAALDLGGNAVNKQAVRDLVTSRNLSGLRVLALDDNVIEAADLEAFAEAHTLPRLTHLNLGYNQIGDRGLRALASSPLTDLVRLDLEMCDLTAASFQHLARSRPLQELLENLRILNLNNNRLSNAGLKALAACRLPHLHTLMLEGNGLEPEADKVLAEAPFRANLLDNARPSPV
jgi:uncharacterized protein (TIGR02996 family)